MGWIQVRDDLPSDPHFRRYARASGLPEWQALGAVVDLWCQTQAHAKLDGDDAVLSLAPGEVDALYFKGMEDALGSVGWLVANGTTLVLPNFTKHNPQRRNARRMHNRRHGGVEPLPSGLPKKTPVPWGTHLEHANEFIVRFDNEAGVKLVAWTRWNPERRRVVEQRAKEEGAKLDDAADFWSLVEDVLLPFHCPGAGEWLKRLEVLLRVGGKKDHFLFAREGGYRAESDKQPNAANVQAREEYGL